MNVPLIQLKNIRHTYHNGNLAVPVLHGIDLTIDAGEFVAIVGASGSGKTTLMNILGCLDRATEGEYLWLGQNIAHFSSDQLAQLRRESFGFIFQSYHLIPTADARENVEVPAIYAGMPANIRAQRATELLTKLGLGERVDHRPNQLSGGQQQRVSIARALMNGGQVILADEPTGALDSRSGQEVMKLLKQLSEQGHTIILITHDAQVADHADRVIEMLDGEILSDNRKANQTPEHTTELQLYENRINTLPQSHLAQITESTWMALRSLKANLFRSALTLLGIVIGVASVIVMLGIGDGAKQAVVDRISSMGTNLLIIRPGAPNMRGRSDVATLVVEDVRAVNQLDNVIAGIPEVSSTTTLRYRNSDHRTSINATWPEFTEVRQWWVEHGSFITQEDEQAYATVAVLGNTVAKALFGQRDPLGEYVLINNLLFQVIGVMTPKGASARGDDQDDIVFVPFSTGSLRISGQKHLRNATVAVQDVSRIDETQEAIRQLLMSRHGTEDFRIFNMSSLLENVSETQNTLTVLLGSIAAISLLVGGIGVMNIMLVNVTERTREIGIRMATGARESNIMEQFLIESMTVSALGGAIGVVIGVSIALIIELSGTPIVFSFWPVLLAFSCAFLTGLVFGYLPAQKAAKLNPVSALASE